MPAQRHGLDTSRKQAEASAEPQTYRVIVDHLLKAVRELGQAGL